jgi:hypothetical protein
LACDNHLKAEIKFDNLISYIKVLTQKLLEKADASVFENTCISCFALSTHSKLLSVLFTQEDHNAHELCAHTCPVSNKILSIICVLFWFLTLKIKTQSIMRLNLKLHSLFNFDYIFVLKAFESMTYRAVVDPPGYIIRHSTISVDYWPRTEKTPITHHFLTHAQSDHLKG